MAHLYNTACPKCSVSGRGKSLSVYDNGEYCHECGYGTRTDNEEDEFVTDNNTESLPGKYIEVRSRGLSKQTCEKMGIQVVNHTGKLGSEFVADKRCISLNVMDDSGNIIKQKIRDVADRSACIQIGKTKDTTLFGQHAFNPTDKLFITVTEGEFDAASIYEATGYPAVSACCGAKGSLKHIKDNLTWLSKWKYVVVCYDNDETGKTATKELVKLFEPGKVRVVNIPLKDANEMLLEGRGSELKKLLWNAKENRPDSIVSVEDIIEASLDKPKLGASWPWPSLTDITYGIQPRSIYTIGAGSGIGKTEVIKDVVCHLCHTEGEKIGIMSFEQHPTQTLKRLAGSLINKRLHVPGTEYDKEEVKDAMMKFKDKLFFYDHFGASDLDTVIANIRYFVKAMDCKHIILDPFTAVVADFEDERKGIDKAMAAFGALVQELECTLFLVCHLSKPSMGKSYEEGRHVAPVAFRGSQAIQYWSSFMIGLERNKLSEDEDERIVTRMRILKDRFTGEADGKVLHLKYNRDTGRLDEHTPEDEQQVIDIIKEGEV